MQTGTRLRLPVLAWIAATGLVIGIGYGSATALAIAWIYMFGV